MEANIFAGAARRPEAGASVSCALLVLGLVLGSFGCSTSPRGSADPGHSVHPNYAKLELNDGKKWVMAKPMMAHIRNLEKEVQEFESTTGQDDAVLAKAIEENLGGLVTNCTMEGKAHDELHKWLMPFLGMSAAYAKATDPLDQQAKLQEIKESLRVFHSYFE